MLNLFLEKLNCEQIGYMIYVLQVGLDYVVVIIQISYIKLGLFGFGFYLVNCINSFFYFGSSRLFWKLLIVLDRKVKISVLIFRFDFWLLEGGIVFCMFCVVFVLRKNVGIIYLFYIFVGCIQVRNVRMWF